MHVDRPATHAQRVTVGAHKYQQIQPKAIAQLTDRPHMLNAVDQQLERVVGTQARVSVPLVCTQQAWGWWSEGSPTQGLRSENRTQPNTTFSTQSPAPPP